VDENKSDRPLVKVFNIGIGRSENSMCKCTPGVRTPYCGKPGCEWPKEKEGVKGEEQMAHIKPVESWPRKKDVIEVPNGPMFHKDIALNGELSEFKYEKIIITDEEIKYQKTERDDDGRYGPLRTVAFSREELLTKEEAKQVAREALERRLSVEADPGEIPK
jgi:hypothetical protein